MVSSQIRYVSVIAGALAVLLAVSRSQSDDAAQQKKTIDALVADLKSDDAQVRRQAVQTLANGGDKAEPALGKLIDATQDENDEVRVMAVWAIGELKLDQRRSVPCLVKALGDRTPTSAGPVWEIAALALGQFGESALPAMLDALRGHRDDVRRGAAMAIASLGPDAKKALDALIKVAKSDESLIRCFAMEALRGLGADAKPAIPVLIQSLSSDDFHTQYFACRALGGIGPDAAIATEHLIRLVKEARHASVRRHAAAALGEIGPKVGPSAVTALIEALSDYSQPVRENAVIALGQLGPLAEPAIPVVEKALNDTRFAPRADAAKTLWLLKPESKAPSIVLMEELQSQVRPWEAARVVGEIGPDLNLVDKVIALLKSDRFMAREYAAEALGRMGPAAAKARGALQLALKDQEPDVREAAEEAIRQIGREQ